MSKRQQQVSLFTLTVPVTDPEGDPIAYYRAVVQQEDDQLVAPGELGWPRWLAFDAAERTFTGTPEAADAPAAFTIAVVASDGKEEGRTTFPLTVEIKTNSRLPEVSRQ